MNNLKALSALVQQSTGPEAPDFYRKLYRMLPGEPARAVDSWEEWRSVPLFSKQDLSASALDERIARSWSRRGTIVVSSGTSGGAPVFSPCTMNDGYGFRFLYHDFKRPVLASIPPYIKKEWEIRQHQPSTHVLAHDPKRVAASVRMARSIGVDSLIVFLYHIPALAEEMDRIGMSREIKYIEVAGERCSRSMYEYMRRIFPNAVILSDYGSSDVETDPIGVPCRPLGGDPLEVFHANAGSYLEIVDPETGGLLAPVKGATGELVITTCAEVDPAFPLIRYRIGDSVRVVEEKCAMHDGWSFEVLGRTHLDFLKVPGGVIRLDEMERVLRGFHADVTDRFELHCYDETANNRARLKISLRVEPQHPLDMQELAGRIAHELRLAPSYTYQDAVDDGFVAPLVCEAHAADPSRKHRSIIRH